jgi:repressor LexA
MRSIAPTDWGSGTRTLEAPIIEEKPAAFNPIVIRFYFAYTLSMLSPKKNCSFRFNVGGFMALTKRQFQLLAFLDSFVERNGYCPSFDEIRRSLKLSSLATVHKHLNNLEKKGFIQRGHNQSRSIEILNKLPLEGVKLASVGRRMGVDFTVPSADTDFELPLLGRIAAGRPVEALSSNESLPLGDFVGKDNVYVLRVKGDSMIEDHICDGDFVIVESSVSAQNGDTIVALIDNNEATLKKFYRDKNNTVRLQPANSKMKPILVREEDLKIQGRVIGVLRRY